MSASAEALPGYEAIQKHDKRLKGILSGVISTGHASRADVVPPDILQGLKQEARFHFYPSDERWRGTGHHRPIIIRPQSAFERVFLSTRNRPTIAHYARMLQTQVQTFGRGHGISELARWTADRVVVNRLRPDTQDDSPGEIYRHTDPEMEKGLAVVVRLDSARATVWVSEGEGTNSHLLPVTEPQHPGHVTGYASADLSEALDIRQPEHAVAASDESLAMVFLCTPYHQPFSLASAWERLHR